MLYINQLLSKMFLLFCVLAFFIPSESAQVPQCNQLHLDLNTTLNPNLTLLYKLSFDVDVQKSLKQHYNNVTFLNISRWSSNESIYYEYYPLYYFLQGMEEDIYCNNTNNICNFEMRDGFGSLSFSLALGGDVEFSEDFLNYFFIDGSVYNSWGGRMFHPDKDPCFHDRIDGESFYYTLFKHMRLEIKLKYLYKIKTYF